MTKHLINYCPIDWYEDELKRKGMTLADLVQQLGVDGIEQFVYREPGAFPDYKDLTFGAHLNIGRTGWISGCERLSVCSSNFVVSMNVRRILRQL